MRDSVALFACILVSSMQRVIGVTVSQLDKSEASPRRQSLSLSLILS